MAERGVFLTFEGPEGSGKSTQLRRLVSRLAERGIDALQTREPGGTRTGEAIRDILQHQTLDEAMFSETELLLFSASRAQVVRGVIQPALKRGQWVVCDRFADSTTVYQGYGRGLPVADILNIHRFVLGGVVPELTLLIDIDVEAGFRRVHERNAASGSGLDRMERENLDFHRRIRQGYLDLASREPHRVKIVNGDQDVLDVAEEIWGHVAPRVSRFQAGRP